ncbi:MAG: OmpH family outer membrane protein [Allosphingosinicella sp.]
MNKFVFGAAIAAFSLTVPGTASAQRNASPILVVDIGRVSTECTACRAAQQQIQTQATQLQQRQQQLAQQLQAQGQPLETAVNALNGKQPDAALQQRIQTFENQRTAAAQELQGRGQQIESTSAHVNQQITDRLRLILEQIRASRNASVVLGKGGTWASAPAVDVTNEALTALNQQLPSVSITPLPQPAQPAQPQPQGR